MKAINSACRIVGYVAMGVIMAIMLLTSADVFMRYCFTSPIDGTLELTEMMMVCLLFALAWCAIEGGHVKVDLVMNFFSARIQAIVDSITLFMCLGIYVIFVWQGFLASEYSRSYDESSAILGVPEFPIFWVLVLSFAVLCIAITNLIIQKIVEAVRK